jgi:hypothetical protein
MQLILPEHTLKLYLLIQEVIVLVFTYLYINIHVVLVIYHLFPSVRDFVL